MTTIPDTSQATAMPMPARTVREQLAAITAGARVNERYELEYPAQRGA
jgi:hypothetical protein